MKKGFTLAEVLITLGIIGVVAALTLPTLIANYQKTQYVAGLKKAYTQLNQVLKQMAADNGCINDLKCTGLFAAGTNSQSLGDEVVKYFKVIKNCGTTEQGCFSNHININYDGSSVSFYNWDATQYYRFITTDGISFSIYNWGNNCQANYSTGALGYMTQLCGYVYIDVNGLNKKPNNYGRDIFGVWITNGKGASLYPEGGRDDNWNHWWSNNFCFPSNRLGTCTGRIMENGWEMDY